MDFLKKLAFLVVILSVLPHDAICTENDNNDDDLEDEMELRLERDDKRVTLRLKKNDNVRDDVPVFTSKNKVMQKVDSTTLPMSKFKAYQDLDNMASILIEDVKGHAKTRSLKTRSYRGTFTINGNPYVLRPTTRTLSPMRESRGTDRQIRTVDLGDITESSYDAKSEMSGVIDDPRNVRMMRNMSTRPDEPEVIERRTSFPVMRNDSDRPVEPEAINVKKRAYKKGFTVEMAIFADYSIYRRFWDEANGNRGTAIKNLRFYFAHIANGESSLRNKVDMRYRTILEDDFAIDVQLVKIHIAETIADSSYTEGYGIKLSSGSSLVYDVLDAFQAYLSKNFKIPGDFDQASLFTANKLYRGYYITGLADYDAVCSHFGSSINKDTGMFGSINTAAHEMGHNLGIVQHDGQTDGPGEHCSGTQQYVMASAPRDLDETNFDNAFTFSTCSINQLRDYLVNRRKSVHRVPVEPNCLENNGGLVHEMSLVISNKAGQRFTPDEQCQLIYGIASYYCAGGYDETICSKMECYVPEERKCQSSAVLRAFDGTSCGNWKWCRRGRCESSSDAPATEESCIYGNYKGRLSDHGYWTCSQLIQYQPYICNQEKERTLCCDSCNHIKDNKNEECPHGDKEGWCSTITSRNCYTESDAQTCCQTCSSFLQPHLPETCKYGDHASWCATIQKHQCSNNADTCCKRCAELRGNNNNNPDCPWGDEASWCSATISQDPGKCYISGTGRICCGSCNARRTGPPGCEYGNKRHNYCSRRISFGHLNCNDPYDRENCWLEC